LPQNSKLTQLLNQMAERCEEDKIDNDAEPNGALHNWVRENSNCKPSQEFYLVFLLSCALADRAARREGYEGQADRAAALMKKALPPERSHP